MFEPDDPAELVRLPGRTRAPLSAVLRRIGAALGLVAFVAVVVRLGRDGYTDVSGDPIGMLDSIYYASVTVTTTGYGDITAVSSGARLATILLITPARILFLILVVGTTVEVLTEQSRRALATNRWRQQMQDHYVICGFGATGGSAAADLLAREVPMNRIIVVDPDRDVVDAAAGAGFAAIQGDASQRAVLDQAMISRAKAVIITPSRDDTAVLITLTAREMNPTVHIVAGGHEEENLHLLRQGGADEVINAPAAVGRMLGLGTYAPGAVQVFEDLLDAGSGMELAQVSPVMVDGVASVPPQTTVVVVVRDGRHVRAEEAGALRSTDSLVVLRDC